MIYLRNSGTVATVRKLKTCNAAKSRSWQWDVRDATGGWIAGGIEYKKSHAVAKLANY